MNEVSAGRFVLAQQLAPYYGANPKVAAVAVEGSVARGFADRYSDIDLTVFWEAAPTEQERREIIKRAGGSTSSLFPLTKGKPGGWIPTRLAGSPSMCGM